MKQMSSMVLAVLPSVIQRNFFHSLVRSQYSLFCYVYIYRKISFLCDDGTNLVNVNLRWQYYNHYFSYLKSFLTSKLTFLKFYLRKLFLGPGKQEDIRLRKENTDQLD
jgi:hypothetical protein